MYPCMRCWVCRTFDGTWEAWLVEPAFSMLGERALLVTLSREVSVEANDLVLRLSRAVEDARISGVDEAQPAYSSLCVHFDPARVRASYVQGFIRQLMQGEDGGENPETRTKVSAGVAGAGAAEKGAKLPGRDAHQVEIPVVYGGDDGPDLEWAAQYLGISQEELIRKHTARPYRVFMIGFTPGFPYLGEMDGSIALPRLPRPRARVPAGSVGIGGNQTGVYPWETPGGWRILGRTAVELFSPYRDDPSLLHPGDTVRFVPVTRGGEAGAGTSGASGAFPAPAGADSAHTVLSLAVEYPGFMTMVVDEGRRRYRKLGVPVSGAADLRSYRFANQLCGNAPGEAALEMTLLGARLRAQVDLTAAVTGAPAPVTIDGKQASMDESLFLPRGSLVEVGSLQSGCRTYLAVAGGIKVPRVMRSRSTYLRGRFGGYQGRLLRPGDLLPVGPAPEHSFILEQTVALPRQTPGLLAALKAPEVVLRVTPGPEAEPSVLEALCSDSYTVSPESDRMGLRFAGRAIADGNGDILSSPVVPGTIQVPSDGRPLLLFCDAQTTGGYRRVATVTAEDLPLAGQLRPGARVAFWVVER